MRSEVIRRVRKMLGYIVFKTFLKAILAVSCGLVKTTTGKHNWDAPLILFFQTLFLQPVQRPKSDYTSYFIPFA